MEQTRFARERFIRARQHIEPRWIAWIAWLMGVVLLFGVSATPASVEAMGSVLFCRDCKGDKVFLRCPGPVMKKPATFASNPPGFASYPFEEQCPVELQTGQHHHGVIHLYFEGRWNPSETRQDRPNAVETLFIENYEQFFPNRQMKGPGERRIFVYWTARCTKDPWLQGGTCQRLGEYVPSDVREAFPRVIEDMPFPITKDSLSAKLKQQLIEQYRAANQPGSARMSNRQRIQSMMTQPQQSPIVQQAPPTQAMVVQPQPPPVVTQSQAAQAQAAQVMEAEPQAAFPKPGASMGALARSGVFARGVEEKDGQISETSDPAVIEEGTPEMAEPVALTLEQPFHATDAKGEAVELKAGAYEIGTILDLQLGIAHEGQRTVLFNANRDTHQIPISRTIAVVIPGPSDDLHLLFLTPDGRRFETIGFPSAVKTRSIDKIVLLPDKTIEAAVRAASVSPRAVSSPPCRPNPSDIGPRWVPVPCTVASP